MSIKILHDEGIYRPAVMCDYCGHEITDAKNGNYEWLINDNGNPVDGTLFFTHKQCCYLFEETNGGRVNWCCDELACLPVYMMSNLKINWKRAKELASFMSAI